MPYTQQISTINDIRTTVDELLRLTQLDLLLDMHSVLTSQLSTAAVWFHGKMMSSSEEGHQVDRAKIVKELSHIAKFMGGSSRGGGGASSHQHPMPPMALAQHFGGQGGSLVWAVMAPPVIMRPGLVSRQDAINAGITEKRVLTISTRTGSECPLVVCHKCKHSGHIERDCKG